MKEIHVCPSTLAEGYDTYSSVARKTLFDGKVISHVIHEPSPSEEDAGFQESIRQLHAFTKQPLVALPSNKVFRATEE